MKKEADELNKIYLIGLGAIGSLFGHKIQEAYQNDFKVLVDAARIEKYKQNEIYINNIKYNFNFENIDTCSEPADLLIFSVKQYQLEEAMAEAEKVIHENTVLISLLNGIESEKDLMAKFPDNRIVHAFCIGQDAVRDGFFINYSKPGKIVFGQLDGNNETESVREIQKVFEASNIQYEISNQIEYDMWKKFLINVSVNQLSAILNAPYGVFHNSEHAQDLLKMAAQEVVDLSWKYHIHLKQDEIKSFIEIMLTLSPEGLTSMLQDVRAGRQTEYEMLSKTVVKMAEEVGLDVPVNRMLYHMMATMAYMAQTLK